MEWEEFTNYIIEKAAVLNTMKSKNDEIKTYHPCDTKIAKKFSQVVAKCIYISYIEKIAFFEEQSDQIHFANAETGQIITKMTLRVEVNDKVKKGDDKNPPVIGSKFAMLLDMIFIDDPKYMNL